MGVVSHPPPSYSKDDEQNYLFNQLDGNISLDSSIISTDDLNDSIDDCDRHTIPTQVGFRPIRVTVQRPPPSWRTIRRDNKKVQALTLPKITNFNMRSLFPKLNNFSEDMSERESDISFLTEVWEKQENRKHQLRLEEMFELKGIKYISTPRPGAQRGGGAAIAVRTEKFTVSKLNIAIPRSVEIIWGLVKPKVVTGKINTIIVVSTLLPVQEKMRN